MRTNLLMLGALLSVACSKPDAPPPELDDFVVSVRTGEIAAPDSTAAGWTRVRVEEDGGGHIIVVFRLAPTATDADIATFLAALDTAAGTPPSGLAIGGPEVGDVGTVVLQLTPGKYLLGCVRRGGDGHRHASGGEAKLVTVTDAPAASPRDSAPIATQEVIMTDFAFTTAGKWAAGSQMLRIENRGSQEHHVRIAQLNAGSTMQQWIDAPDDHGETIAGIARMGPGAIAFVPTDLPRGMYVLYCLITDPASNKVHVELGMMRSVQLE